MMNAVYLSVVLVFLLILCRKHFPRLSGQAGKGQEKQSPALPGGTGKGCVRFRVVSIPVFTLAYVSDFISQEVERALDQTCRELYENGCTVAGHAESIVAGSCLLFVIPYLDKEPVQKEGGKK